MGENSWWKGKVDNKSKFSLWIIYDKDGAMYAEVLLPHSKSPSIDVDGVKTCNGYKINGHDSWWKLKNGAEVEISDKNGIISMEQTSFIGDTWKFQETSWGKITYIEKK